MASITSMQPGIFRVRAVAPVDAVGLGQVGDGFDPWLRAASWLDIAGLLAGPERESLVAPDGGADGAILTGYSGIKVAATWFT